MSITAASSAPPAELPTERLEAEILTLSGHLAAATATLLGWLGEYDRREGWRSWGCQSCAHWLSWKCGTSLHTAREQVRVARALAALPATSAAFARGQLSYSKVRAITRVADADEEQRWLHVAQHATARELDRLAGGVRSAKDRADNRSARDAFDRRGGDRSRANDGCDTVRLKGPVELVQVLWQAIDAEVERLAADAAAGDITPSKVISARGGYSAMRFDALVSLAQASLRGGDGGVVEGDPRRLSLHVDTVVTDANGHPRDVGRASRVVRGRLRRLLEARDQGCCRFPGCGATRWLHAHHITHWAQGGRTDLDNLVLVCPFHHHLLHEGGWTVALAGDGAVFVDPDGVATEVPVLHGQVSGLTGRRGHEHIDAGTCQPRWYRDHLDYGYAVAALLPFRYQVGDVPAGTPSVAQTVSDTGDGRSVRRSTPPGGEGGGGALGSSDPPWSRRNGG